MDAPAPTPKQRGEGGLARLSQHKQIINFIAKFSDGQIRKDIQNHAPLTETYVN
jgi:hypothetical protein